MNITSIVKPEYKNAIRLASGTNTDESLKVIFIDSTFEAIMDDVSIDIRLFSTTLLDLYDAVCVFKGKDNILRTDDTYADFIIEREAITFPVIKFSAPKVMSKMMSRRYDHKERIEHLLSNMLTDDFYKHYTTIANLANDDLDFYRNLREAFNSYSTELESNIDLPEL